MRLTENFGALLKSALEMISLTVKNRLFAIFLSIDGAFIGLHVYVATRPREVPGSPIQYLRIDKDLGMSEFFEYIALAAGLVATLILIRRTRDRCYWMVAGLILYLFIDDAFSIHEILGPILYRNNANVGEAVPNLVAGSVFGLWGLICLWRSNGATKAVLTAVGISVAVIAFFGIGVDTLHGAFIVPFSPFDGPITLIEDGCELVGLTFLSALMLTALGRSGNRASQDSASI
jgi:hypothetical protein